MTVIKRTEYIIFSSDELHSTDLFNPEPYAFIMSPYLKEKIEEIVGEEIDYNVFGFLYDSGIKPNINQELCYLIIKNSFLKDTYDSIDLSSLIKVSGGETVVFVKDNMGQAEQLIDNIEAGRVMNAPSFIIDELGKIGNTFTFIPTSPFSFNGRIINNVDIVSNKEIKVGDTIKIDGIEMGVRQARIIGESLSIYTNYDNITITNTPRAIATTLPPIPTTGTLQIVLEDALTNNDELIRIVDEAGADRAWFLGVAEDSFLNNDNTINFPRIREFFRENGRNVSEPARGGTATPEPTPSDDEPETQSSIQEIREKAIEKIKKLLGQEDYVINNDDLNRNDWEDLINNSDDIDYIENLTAEVLADIHGRIKEKIDNNVLSELVQKAQKIENYEELKKEIEKIERFRGQEVYDSLETEINALRKKLAEKNPEDYLGDNVQMIKKEMEEKGVNEDELDTDDKDILKKLENGEITEPTEVDIAKNKISNSISQISTKKKLGELIRKYQECPDEAYRKNIRKKLLNFISTKNSFNEKAYQSRKSEVDELLGIGSSKLNSSKSSKGDDFPLAPVIIIGSLFIFLVGSAIIISKQRSRRI